MQKIAGLLKEDADLFLDAVFDHINDEMRLGHISEEDFIAAKNYLDSNEMEIAGFDNGEQSGVEKAVDYLMSKLKEGVKEDETLEPEAGVSDEEEIDLDGDTETDSWNKPDPDDTDEFEKEPTTRDIKGTKDLTGVLKYQADLKDLVNMKDTILTQYKSGQIGLDQYKQKIGNIPQMIKKLRSQIEKAMNVTVDDEEEAGM
jgi:hypothetical protein